MKSMDCLTIYRLNYRLKTKLFLTLVRDIFHILYCFINYLAMSPNHVHLASLNFSHLILFLG